MKQIGDAMEAIDMYEVTEMEVEVIELVEIE